MQRRTWNFFNRSSGPYARVKRTKEPRLGFSKSVTNFFAGNNKDEQLANLNPAAKTASQLTLGTSVLDIQAGTHLTPPIPTWVPPPATPVQAQAHILDSTSWLPPCTAMCVNHGLVAQRSRGIRAKRAAPSGSTDRESTIKASKLNKKAKAQGENAYPTVRPRDAVYLGCSPRNSTIEDLSRSVPSFAGAIASTTDLHGMRAGPSNVAGEDRHAVSRLFSPLGFSTANLLTTSPSPYISAPMVRARPLSEELSPADSDSVRMPARFSQFSEEFKAEMARIHGVFTELSRQYAEKSNEERIKMKIERIELWRVNVPYGAAPTAIVSGPKQSVSSPAV